MFSTERAKPHNHMYMSFYYLAIAKTKTTSCSVLHILQPR